MPVLCVYSVAFVSARMMKLGWHPYLSLLHTDTLTGMARW